MGQVTILQYAEEQGYTQNIKFLKDMHDIGGHIVIISKFKIEPKEREFSYYIMDKEENLPHSLNKLIESDLQGDLLFINSNVTLNYNSYKEMYRGIYNFEKYGVISPNDLIENEGDLEKVYEYFKPYSRKTQISQECFLIKGDLIKNFGKFNISFWSLEFALKDFMERINNFGYQYICANYAFIEKNDIDVTIDCKKEKDIDKFYSIYDYALKLEIFKKEHSIKAVERFWPLLKNNHLRKKKILFECQNMPAFYNGTSEHQLSLFNAFYDLYNDKYEIFICVNHYADHFHEISKKYSCVIYPENISGVFDLGFSVTQPFSLEQQFFLNKYCLKIIYNILDSIILRCNEHQRHNFEIHDIAKLGVKLCDGLTTISEFSKNDFKYFFEEDGYSIKKPIKRIYNASNFIINKTNCSLKVPFSKYFLVVGNSLKHKAIKETVNTLKENNNFFIVLGQEDEGYVSNNIYTYPSGYLQESDLAYLYANCKAIIFPSFYEGFGLPILIAIKNGKKIILLDNELNRELQNYLSEFDNRFIFFKTIKDIDNLIGTIDIDVSEVYSDYNYTWEDVAYQIEQFFDKILKLCINPEELEERWDLFNFIQRNRLKDKDDTRSWKIILLEDLSYKNPRLYGFLKKIYLLKKRIFGDNKIDERKIAKSYKLEGNRVIGGIVSNIDKMEVYKYGSKRYLYISGWAFEKTIDIQNSKTYITFNGRDFYSTFKIYRDDVIKHYNQVENIKFKNVGFEAYVPINNIIFNKDKINIVIKDEIANTIISKK